MAEPGWIEVSGPGVALKASSRGSPTDPMALRLHGFPDTAYSWSRLVPRLVAAGWRVGWPPCPTAHSARW